MISPVRRSVHVLRIFWLVVVLYYEYVIFFDSVKDCTWPDTTWSQHEPSNLSLRPFHLLVVADPQILDRNSYPGRSSLLSYLTQLVVDLNLRKSWRVAVSKGPDAVVFLGDMMDGGRFQDTESDYDWYYRRFKSIFASDPSTPQYFIPGNHDIGLGQSTMSRHAYPRYVSHFGKMNLVLSVANHSLVLINAPALADEDHQRHVTGKSFRDWNAVPNGPIDLVKKVSNDRQLEPRILFTHIPLYRPDGTNCGPLREKGTIRPGGAIGYQNTLGKHATTWLLESVQPLLILSGDDHDYCEYGHHYQLPDDGPIRKAREVSVKSIAMVMNVRKPGFQLLSLAPEALRANNTSRASHADIPCLLPDQLGIYLRRYIPLLVLSILLLVIRNSTRRMWVVSQRPSGTMDHDMTLEATSSRHAGYRVYGRHKASEDVGHLLPVPTPSSRRSRRRWCASRLGPGKPTVLGDVLRDVRDVAVVPIGTFMLICAYSTYLW